MATAVKTIKLHLHVAEEDVPKLTTLTEHYTEACNYISQYIFDNDFVMAFMAIHKALYHNIRDLYGLKSQMAISAVKTVIARYRTREDQMKERPYKFTDDTGKLYKFDRTLEWSWKPIHFSRPQADLVRGRDYTLASSGLLSLNTLEGRIRVPFDKPDYYAPYLGGNGWKLGTGKLVKVGEEWYFHIPVSKQVEGFDIDNAKHVVGVDRGLRFMTVAYDEKGKVFFVDGKRIMQKRETFARVRAELQSKGTKSAKRVLKRISGRENRWMTDVNHQVSKTLVEKYGPNTLFVIEDLTGVSFCEENLNRGAKANRQLSSWAFYQFEQFLTYKAIETGSAVVKVEPAYTSQRCPKCGRVRKANRNHEKHEYRCNCCGYRSNDDRVGAMNIQMLGTLYVSGDPNPKIRVRKKGL